MSRHHSTVSAEQAQVLAQYGLDTQEPVTVAHGYDRPMTQYFLQVCLGEDKYLDVYYGSGIGLGHRLRKGQYYELVHALGLTLAARAVALDLQY